MPRLEERLALHVAHRLLRDPTEELLRHSYHLRATVTENRRVEQAQERPESLIATSVRSRRHQDQPVRLLTHGLCGYVPLTLLINPAFDVNVGRVAMGLVQDREVPFQLSLLKCLQHVLLPQEVATDDHM